MSLQAIIDAVPFPENPTLRRAKPIARMKDVDCAYFQRQHLEGFGVPLVVSDAIDHWKARDCWTFDLFRDRYGEDTVEANSPMFLEAGLGLAAVKARMTLENYINYVLDPSRQPVCDFLIGDYEKLKRNRVPLYAPTYCPLVLHPELKSDIEASPYFVHDLLAASLPPSMISFLDRVGNPIHDLFFAPTNATAYLHADYWGTHFYLAQLQGRKLCILFSPADNENLYRVDDCTASVLNPLEPKLSDHPRFAQATPYVALLEKHDLLFVPSGWWHFVVALEPSITLGYNFFTVHNMRKYFAHLFEGLGRLMKGGFAPDDLSEALDELATEVLAEIAVEHKLPNWAPSCGSLWMPPA